MTEAELQKWVIEVAHTFGWLVAHFRTAQSKKGNWITPVAADGKGFPDLCLVRERVVFIELKVGYRKLTLDQELWRDRIILAGGEWWFVSEKEWASGLVEEILKPEQVSVGSAMMG